MLAAGKAYQTISAALPNILKEGGSLFSFLDIAVVASVCKYIIFILSVCVHTFVLIHWLLG